MANLHIELQGLPQLIAKLGRSVANDTLAKAMTKATARLQSTLQQYPPPPSGSTYVRTGDLGRSWFPTVTSGGDVSGRTVGVVGSVGNAVRSRRTGKPYARYVQADPSERYPHQTVDHELTGWTTDVQALEKNRSAIEGDFKQAIDDALSR